MLFANALANYSAEGIYMYEQTINGTHCVRRRPSICSLAAYVLMFGEIHTARTGKNINSIKKVPIWTRTPVFLRKPAKRSSCTRWESSRSFGC